MENKYEKDAKVFKALCDEKRLYIMELLREGEKCACVLTDITNIKQSALSYHMKILCESGLVENWQDGKWINYRLSKEGCEKAKILLDQTTKPKNEQVPNSYYLENLNRVDAV